MHSLRKKKIESIFQVKIVTNLTQLVTVWKWKKIVKRLEI